MFPADVGGVL